MKKKPLQKKRWFGRILECRVLNRKEVEPTISYCPITVKSQSSPKKKKKKSERWHISRDNVSLSLSPSLFSRAPIYVLDIVQVTEDDGSAYSFPLPLLWPDTLPKVWQLSLPSAEGEKTKREFRCFIFRCSSKKGRGAQRPQSANPFVNGFCHCQGVGKKRKKSRPFFFFFSIFMLSPPRSLCMKEEERTRMV